jgi:hypothetical protein
MLQILSDVYLIVILKREYDHWNACLESYDMAGLARGMKSRLEE